MGLTVEAYNTPVGVVNRVLTTVPTGAGGPTEARGAVQAGGAALTGAAPSLSELVDPVIPCEPPAWEIYGDGPPGGAGGEAPAGGGGSRRHYLEYRVKGYTDFLYRACGSGTLSCWVGVDQGYGSVLQGVTSW